MTRPNTRLPARKIPKIDQFKLENGLQGLLLDIPDCTSVSAELYFRAGQKFSPPDHPELAHCLEHLVFGANESYPSQESFSKVSRRFGSHFNAHTDDENIWYEFTAPDFDWQRSFELLLEAVSRPLFLATEFETEMKAVRQELVSKVDDEDHVFLYDLVRELGLKRPPYEERIKKLKNIALKNIENYYRQTHGLANARLIMAGSLPDRRRRWIKQQLKDLQLPATKARWQTGLDDTLRPLGVFHRPKPSRQGILCSLHFVNNQRELQLSESDTALIMNVLFTHGYESRIWGQLRNQGLVYHIGCNLLETYDSSDFYFAWETQLENVEGVVDLILAEIDRLLAGGLEDEELEAIALKVLGNFLLRTFSPPTWIRHYRNHWLEDDVIVPAQLHERIEAISPKKVIALARHLFEPKQWTLGLYGPVPENIKRKLKTKLDNWQPGQSS